MTNVVDAGGAGRHDARDVLVRHERALEHGVVAAVARMPSTSQVSLIV